MMPEPNLKPPLCSEHRIPMAWGETDFTFDEGDVLVVVRHIPGWVCPYGDDTAFAPGVADEVIRTTRELVKVAKHARETQPQFPKQEYLVRVVA